MISQLIEEYIDYLETNDKSRQTIINYRIDLKEFQNYIESKNLNITEIDSQHIEEYKKYLKGKGFKGSTRARRIISLRNFYKYLEIKHSVPNPAKNIEIPKAEKRDPVYLTLKQAKKIIKATEGERFEKRDKLILLIFLTTGLRAEELTNIKLSDITEDTLRVIGKGNRTREVILNSNVIEALKEYIKVRPNVSEYLFISNMNTHMSKRAIQDVVKKYIKKAKLDAKKYSTHKLRHTAATLMLESGIDLRTIQEILGHKQISTTEIYTHVNKSQKQKAAGKLNNIFD